MPTSRTAPPPDPPAPAPPSPACGCARCRAHAADQFGPYTPREFVELFGVANEPGPVEVPAELAALGIELDAALERRERAFGAWSDAMRRGADEAEARAVLEDEDERLGAARVAYNDLARRLSERRTMEEYAADQAEQAAQREAARAAREGAGWRSRMGRIRAKVMTG